MRAVLWALALFALASPAFAQECDKATWASAKASMERHGYTVAELATMERANFEANYNAVPPVSNDHFDHIFTAAKDGEVHGVILTEKGCVMDAQPIDTDTLAKMEKPPGDGI